MTSAEYFFLLERSISIAWKNTIAEAGTKLTNRFRDELVSKIKKQQFKWKPLSPAYKQRKKKLGLDQRTLIASTNYIKNIRARKFSPTAYIVDLPNKKIPPSRLNKRPKITFKKLAQVHEFGSRAMNIPARPHWGPQIQLYKRNKAKLDREVEEIFKKNYKREMKRLMKIASLMD